MKKQPYESLRGENNPMCRPDVAAKQSASLRKTWADPVRRKEMAAKASSKWTLEMRQAQSERLKASYEKGRARVGPKWSDERREKQRQQMAEYWAKVRAALAVMGESQHDD